MNLTSKYSTKQILLFAGLLILIIVYGISIMNRHTDYWVFELAAKRLLGLESITRYENMAYSYPPFFAVIIMPVTLLPTVLGSWIFYGLSWIAFGFSVKYVMLIFETVTEKLNIRSSDKKIIVVVSFLLAGRYILNNFEHLQFDVFVFLTLILAVHLYLKKKIGSAAFFLAVSISLKVTPLLLFVYFVYKKEFRLIFLTSIILLGLNLIPELIFGIQRGVSYNWEWIKAVVLKMDSQHLSSDEIAAIWPPNSIMNQSIKPWIYRLFTDNSVSIKGMDYQPNVLGLSPIISSRMASVLNLFLLLSSAVMIYKNKINSQYEFFKQISIVLCLMLLISPVSSKPHFITLVCSHLVIFIELTGRNYRKKYFYGITALLFVLGFLPPLLGSWVDQICQMIGFTTLHALIVWMLLIRIQISTISKQKIQTQLN